MTGSLIKLASPQRRINVTNFEVYKYKTSDILYLDWEPAVEHADFFLTCLTRKTERIFHEPTLADVSKLLWFSVKTFQVGRDLWGSEVKHKPVPSSGGRHPVDIIYITYLDDMWKCFLYDDYAHALLLFPLETQKIEAFVQRVSMILDPQMGSILWFISQDMKVSSKYENAESLIWRDAGAILGHLALVAQALELNFCPLGITGAIELEQLLGLPSALSALGGGIVGRAKS